jgi:hypothetical protein
LAEPLPITPSRQAPKAYDLASSEARAYRTALAQPRKVSTLGAK